MSKKPGTKITFQSKDIAPKNKLAPYLFLGVGFILFFTLFYPRFVPILAKYTVVKHIADKGGNIKDYEMSEFTFSNEKNFYIVNLIDKKSHKKRELGVSSKFLPTSVEYDIEP